MRKYAAIAASLLVAFVLMTVSSAKADNFTFTTGDSAYLVNIGNDGTQGTNYDTLQLTGLSSTTGDLSFGSSVTMPISTVDFTAGYNCVGAGPACPNSGGNIPFTVTVNGVNETLSPSFTDVIGDSDTLTIDSATVWFTVPAGGFLELTSLSYGPIVMNSPGLDQGTLMGTFSYTATTPEPVSMVLMGTFLSLAGGLLGKKKRAA